MHFAPISLKEANPLGHSDREEQPKAQSPTGTKDHVPPSGQIAVSCASLHGKKSKEPDVCLEGQSSRDLLDNLQTTVDCARTLSHAHNLLMQFFGVGSSKIKISECSQHCHVLGSIYVFFFTLFGYWVWGGGVFQGIVGNLLMQFFALGSSTIEVSETALNTAFIWEISCSPQGEIYVPLRGYVLYVTAVFLFYLSQSITILLQFIFVPACWCRKALKEDQS